MIQKKNMILMLGIGFLQGMVFYSAIATLYRQAAGISMVQMALIESASLLLSMALEIPWGVAADRLGYKKTMIVCCFLFAANKVIFWQAESFGMFLLERILLAITVSGLSGVDASILYLSCPEDKQQKVFGWWNALGNVGLLIASVAFTLFMADDYRPAALFTVFTYGAAAILTLFLDEVHGSANEKKPAIAGLQAYEKLFDASEPPGASFRWFYQALCSVRPSIMPLPS